MNYSRTKFIKELADTSTGEVKHYQEVKGFKRTAAKGWRMTYTSYLEEVLCELNGKKKTQILFWIFNQFTKNKTEVSLNQKRIAKIFETTQPYVSRVFRELTKMNVIHANKSNSKLYKYRLNPYLYIPAGSNATLLQDEWDLLTNMPSKIKDKFEYLNYLQSDEWKALSSECKSLAKNQCSQCKSTSNLECHHLTYDNLYLEKQSDLQCLCNECHTKIHKGTPNA